MLKSSNAEAFRGKFVAEKFQIKEILELSKVVKLSKDPVACVAVTFFEVNYALEISELVFSRLYVDMSKSWKFFLEKMLIVYFGKL